MTKVAFFPFTPLSDLFAFLSESLVHTEITINDIPKSENAVVIAATTKDAIMAIHKCKQTSVTIIWIGNILDKDLIRGAVNFNPYNGVEFDKKALLKLTRNTKQRKITIEPDYLKGLIQATIPIDLLSLLQSALYICSPKIKRKLCRQAMLEWLRDTSTDFNDFMIAKGFKPVPDELNQKVALWHQNTQNKPDFLSFIDWIKGGESKKAIIEKGESLGLSSFESVTFYQWKTT